MTTQQKGPIYELVENEILDIESVLSMATPCETRDDMYDCVGELRRMLTKIHDLESIHNKVKPRKRALRCWKCLSKKGPEYPGGMVGKDGKCTRCDTEGTDIGLSLFV